MKRWLLALCLSTSIYAAAEDKQLPITNFSGGLNSYFSPKTIDDTQVKDAQDVLFDEDNAVTKRKGFSDCGSRGTYAYDSGWTYTDSSNTTWLIVRGSDTIMAGSSPCTFTVDIATISPNNIVNAVNAFGKIFFVDVGQGVYSWDGTTTTYISGSPLGSLITEFRNRLWVAGLAVPNGNQLYASGYLSGTNWTTGSLSTDPFILTVGLQDNLDNISALFSGYNDMLSVFKSHSIYGILGFDQTDLSARILNREVGCLDGRSIQPYLGDLIFASQRGIEAWDGVNATLISRQVKNKVDPAIQVSGFSAQSWAQSVPADWNAGTFNQSNSLSSIVASPALTVSTFTVTDLSPGTYNFTDTFSTMGNWSTVGSFPACTASGNAANSNTSECRMSADKSIISNFLVQANVSRTSSCGVSCQVNIAALNSSNQGYFAYASDTNNNTVKICRTSDYTAGVGTYCTSTVCSAANNSAPIILTMTRNSLGLLTLYVDGTSVCSGTDTTYTSFSRVGIGAGTNNNQTISSFYSTPRMFNSQVYDTGTVGTSVQAQASWTAGTYTPVFGVFAANASNGSFAQISGSTGTNNTGKEFVYYSSTITPVSPGTTPPLISNVTLISDSSGAFKSQIRNVGSIGSWGNFSTVENLNGGNIAFSICSSTNSNMGPPTNCAVQAINSQITIATATYTQWYATFTVTAATQTPTINSATVQWFSGTRAAPMASVVYDNRYWLSLSTVTSVSASNAILVLTKGPVWSVFKISAGALIPYKNSLYHTNNSNNGKVYLDWQGYNDDGDAINAFIRSKDYMPEGFMVDKVIKSLHLLAEPLGSYTLSSAYEPDSNGTLYSFADVNVNEFSGTTSLNLPVPNSNSYAPYAKSFSVMFGNNVVNQPMKVYGGNLVYAPRPIIQ